MRGLNLLHAGPHKRCLPHHRSNPSCWGVGTAPLVTPSSAINGPVRTARAVAAAQRDGRPLPQEGDPSPPDALWDPAQQERPGAGAEDNSVPQRAPRGGGGAEVAAAGVALVLLLTTATMAVPIGPGGALGAAQALSTPLPPSSSPEGPTADSSSELAAYQVVRRGFREGTESRSVPLSPPPLTPFTPRPTDPSLSASVRGLGWRHLRPEPPRRQCGV